MAPSEAKRFIETTLDRITGKYRQIETERVYLLLSDVSIGSPSPGLEVNEAEFVVETLNALRSEFSGLATGDVQLALGTIAQETDRARRMGGFNAPPAEPTTPRLPDEPVRRGRKTAVSTGYVRADLWSYVRAWDTRTGVLELRFESEEDLTRFSDALARTNRFTEELDPAPPEYAALTVVVGVGADEKTQRFGASVIESTGTEVSLDVPNLPVGLRKAAAQRRAKISAAHSSVATPVVDAGGLTSSVARQAVPAKTNVVDVSTPRAATSSNSPVAGSARRAAARSRQNETVPPPVTEEAEDGFSDLPTGEEGRGSSVSNTEPGRGAARRRRARANLRTGGQPIEDELKRFGRRTGRRVRTRSHQKVQTDALAQAESPAEPSDVTPKEFAERMPSGIVDTKAHPVSVSTKANHNTVPSTPEPEPKAPEDDVSPPPAEPIPTPVQRAPEPPPKHATRRDDPPHLAYSGSVPAVPDLQVGALLGRKDGGGGEGGAAAIALAAAALFPASMVSINTEVRTWKLAIREELALHVEVTPPDPRFTIESAVKMSGLVEASDLGEAVFAANASGEDLTDVLVRNRKLLFRQIDAIMSARAQLMFSSLFDEDVQSYAIFGHEMIESTIGSPVPLAPVAWQHLRKVSGDLDQSELETLLEPHFADRPTFLRDAYISELTLRLASKELKFVKELLGGDATVAQAAAKSPMRRRPTLALIVSLDWIGMLGWKKVETSATRINRVWSVIQAKVKDISNGTNPFELLEAHWSSDEKLVGESFIALCRMLDMDYVELHGTPEQQASVKELRQGLVDTRMKLAERADRHKHRCEVVDAFNRKNAVMLYEKQAELALFKGDYASAEDSLRRVVEMAPHHPTAPPQLRAVTAALAEKK